MSDLEASRASLKQMSEERFRLLVESVRDYAIFMLDREGNVISWNSGAERITGFKATEILGEHFSRFYPLEDMVGDKCPRCDSKSSRPPRAMGATKTKGGASARMARASGRT